MFGTRRFRWGSFARIGIPPRVFGAATTQQLLPIADPGSKRSRSNKSGLATLKSCSVPCGNLFCAVRRLKSSSFGKGDRELDSLPSSGVSQEENLGAKNS